MTLSNLTIHNLANALKPEVLDMIQYKEQYISTMHELIADAIQDKLGLVDDEVLTELTFFIFDSLTLE